jgi:hypothetical protein
MQVLCREHHWQKTASENHARCATA